MIKGLVNMELVLMKAIVILVSICYVMMALDYWKELNSRVLEGIIISFNVLMGLYMSLYTLTILTLTNALLQLLLIYTLSNLILLLFFSYKQKKTNKAANKKDELQRTLKNNL